MEVVGGPLDPPGQRARRRLLPDAPASPSCAPLRPELRAGARRRARDGASWSPASTSPTSSSRYEYLALRRRAGYPIEDGPRGDHRRATTSRVRDFARPRRGGARAALERAARPARRRRPRPVRRRPAGPLHAQPRPAAPRSRARRPRRPGSATSAATRSGRSSCARSRSSRPVDEALRIIDGWTGGAGRRACRCRPGPARGYGASEAPRGVLFHRYVLDDDGDHPRRADRAADLAEPARASRPTCARWSTPGPTSTTHALQHRCEHAIRNYDPCISCATHFLDLTVERS